jgi:hypothetical protein
MEVEHDARRRFYGLQTALAHFGTAIFSPNFRGFSDRFHDQNRPVRSLYFFAMGTDSQNYGTCHGCAHFYITYDPRFPYGCQAFQFKSRRHPQQEVVAATQAPCIARTPRSPRPAARSSADQT